MRRKEYGRQNKWAERKKYRRKWWVYTHTPASMELTLDTWIPESRSSQGFWCGRWGRGPWCQWGSHLDGPGSTAIPEPRKENNIKEAIYDERYIVVTISRCSWWGVVLAEYILHCEWLCIASRPVLGDVVRWLFMYRGVLGVRRVLYYVLGRTLEDNNWLRAQPAELSYLMQHSQHIQFPLYLLANNKGFI